MKQFDFKNVQRFAGVEPSTGGMRVCKTIEHVHVRNVVRAFRAASVPSSGGEVDEAEELT